MYKVSDVSRLPCIHLSDISFLTPRTPAHQHKANMVLCIAPILLTCILLLHSSSAAPVIQKRSESGPHITTDFPDPSIIRVGSTWYAFAGQSLYDYKSTHIQIATSTDFETWTLQAGNDVLPDLPSWVDSSKNHVWAPDINQLVRTLGHRGPVKC